MIRRWGLWGAIVTVAVLAVAAGLYGLRQARSQTPLTITGPNILPNNDFSKDTDGNGLPDGWTSAAPGVKIITSTTVVKDTGQSVQILGTNNSLISPYIAARPGVEYRVAFRALSDSPSATRVRVLFHWRDADGIDFEVTRGDWQDVPSLQWGLISAAGVAPADAVQVGISIHPASDDRVYVADLSMGQLGVRVAPWPEGKRAALAFSFDYETAMGGLIHSRSVEEPNVDATPTTRGLRMRQGAEQALKLFAPANIRATFYTNGYNFLTGNAERREFMNNPVYEWASTEPGHNWRTNRWQTESWFVDDPHQTEAEAPAWYFGSQIATLIAAGQDIQSHTFSHFAGTYVKPEDWRADFAAWKEVAQERDVQPATSLAFPWSSSYGMRFDSWQVLAREGIRSVTRTVWNPDFRRSFLADRSGYALRRVPAQPEIAVIGDVYLTPESRDSVLAQMQAALLNEGAIDVWAHTEEVTSPAQIAAWQTAIDAARQDFWIAPVPEIVQYAQDIRQVTVEVKAENPSYEFTVRNGSAHDLEAVTLTLPFASSRIEIDGQPAVATGTTLILDLKRGQTRTIILARESAQATPDHVTKEALWPV
ncbi:MAG TPA: hypothetical protein VGD58_09190 [Herpetosiphonaceae bacterium]